MEKLENILLYIYKEYKGENMKYSKTLNRTMNDRREVVIYD
jgi:hypothetical protein